MSGHGFDRAKVKNYVSRLSDEDADKIVSFASIAYEAGLAGMSETIPPRFVDNDVACLSVRLGLYGGEIEGIQAEALEAGRSDGGHLHALPPSSEELQKAMSSWTTETILRNLAEVLIEKSVRAKQRSDTDLYRRLNESATVVIRAAEVIQTKKIDG